MVHNNSRFVVPVLLAALLATTGGAQAADQADVCFSSKVDSYLKITDIVGESRADSEERCDRDATITTHVSPETEQPLRPAETIIIIVPQKPGSSQ